MIVRLSSDCIGSTPAGWTRYSLVDLPPGQPAVDQLQVLIHSCGSPFSATSLSQMF